LYETLACRTKTSAGREAGGEVGHFDKSGLVGRAGRQVGGQVRGGQEKEALAAGGSRHDACSQVLVRNSTVWKD